MNKQLKMEVNMKTKTKMTWNVVIVSLFAFVWILTMGMASNNLQDDEKWVAPAAAAKVANPTDASNADGQIAGKTLYMKHCKSCHGKTGLGDGPKAEELDTPSGDFTAADFQGQSDGSIFFKIKEGREDMPSFKKKITDDEDIWLVVNFVRTLK